VKVSPWEDRESGEDRTGAKVFVPGRLGGQGLPEKITTKGEKKEFKSGGKDSSFEEPCVFIGPVKRGKSPVR